MSTKAKNDWFDKTFGTSISDRIVGVGAPGSSAPEAEGEGGGDGDSGESIPNTNERESDVDGGGDGDAGGADGNGGDGGNGRDGRSDDGGDGDGGGSGDGGDGGDAVNGGDGDPARLADSTSSEPPSSSKLSSAHISALSAFGLSTGTIFSLHCIGPKIAVAASGLAFVTAAGCTLATVAGAFETAGASGFVGFLAGVAAVASADALVMSINKLLDCLENDPDVRREEIEKLRKNKETLEEALEEAKKKLKEKENN